MDKNPIPFMIIIALFYFGMGVFFGGANEFLALAVANVWVAAACIVNEIRKGNRRP